MLTSLNFYCTFWGVLIRYKEKIISVLLARIELTARPSCVPHVSEWDPRSDREILSERVSGGGSREAQRGEPSAEDQLLTLPFRAVQLCCPQSSPSSRTVSSCSKDMFIFHMIMGCGLNLSMVVSQPEARKSSVRIELKWRTPPSCRPRCCLKRTNRELLYFLHHCLHQSDWRLNTSSASCCWRRLQHHRFEWSCVFYS